MAQLNLKLVNVIFRHGDRIPESDSYESFPTSPYAEADFYPYRYGQLTNKGKQRAYDLGKYIRGRYSEFLGDTYNPNILTARSSDLDRTKASLQAVIIGMYPPPPEAKWSPELNLNNIEINYVPWNKDSLLLPVVSPKFISAVHEVESLPEVQEEVGKFRGFLEDLSKWTGSKITTMKQCGSVYQGLSGLQSFGLPLPAWTTGIFPKGMLFDAACLHYRIQSYNNILKALNGGAILKYFTKSMLDAVPSEGPPERKIVLLSGHDTNIAGLLATLGTPADPVPDYCSAIFVELWAKNEAHFVKIHYYPGSSDKRVPLKLPGCDELCSLDDFIKLFSDALPAE
ncbi:venom acid phosphatase Acph-1-like [Diachasmimorpha longicaudata]|uniref:venom acid phosphatase Acph-1-like n=1 Tax=Diachasmimorpha longicaudata TaxID=58733 RepID=UPI0030B91338